MPYQPPGAKGIDWAAVRRDYEAGLSYKELAKKYDVADRTIKERKKTDALRFGIIWSRKAVSEPESGDGQTVEPPTRFSSKVLQFPGTIDASPLGEIVDDGAKIGNELALHPNMVALMRQVAERAARDFIAGQLLPGQNQSKADVADKIGSMFERAITVGRQVAGLKDGAPSVQERSDDDGRLVIEQQVIEPKMLPVNEKGRVAK